MSKKLSLSGQSRKTIEEVFGDFVISQTAQGLSETTIATYRCHIHSMCGLRKAINDTFSVTCLATNAHFAPFLADESRVFTRDEENVILKPD